MKTVNTYAKLSEDAISTLLDQRAGRMSVSDGVAMAQVYAVLALAAAIRDSSFGR